MKRKELISIIKSGLVGALAFAAVSFIWFIISIFGGMHRPTIVTTFMDSPKFGFAKEVLIVIVCFGFILGVLLSRYFPIIQRRFYLLVIALVIIVVPLGCGIWWWHEMWMGTELPQVSLKLADCTNNLVNIHLKVPKGHAYYLELAPTNGGSLLSYEFSGNILISNETSLIANFPISSDNFSRYSSSYILTGAGNANTNHPPLSKFVEAQKDYTIQITFDPPPPTNSSIQLHWWQYVKDR